jgi:hypothetical protein
VGWPATDAECSRWTFALRESALRALGLLAAAGGSEAAFFTLPGEPPANAAIVAHVEESVPAHGGEHRWSWSWMNSCGVRVAQGRNYAASRSLTRQPTELTASTLNSLVRHRLPSEAAIRDSRTTAASEISPEIGAQR